jgi:DNA-binding NtrC family response regulator
MFVLQPVIALQEATKLSSSNIFIVMNSLSILIVKGLLGLTEGMKKHLTNEGFHVYETSGMLEAISVLNRSGINILLVELDNSHGNRWNFIQSIIKKHPDLETIVLGENVREKQTQEMHMNFVSEYLTTPFQWKDVLASIRRTRSFLKLQDQIEKPGLEGNHFPDEFQKNGYHQIIGSSSAIKSIKNLITLVAKSDDTSVLITGESGTGKELVARGIHKESNRNNFQFHAVNCSAIPDSLFESEFFGYRKGAFTGAIEKSMGWFELANHGTLFLDEISELPLCMQSKFLRVLDDKTISKIGSHQELRLNLRIISATNQDIHLLMDKNIFRKDLFHRLDSFHIHIPPLRERKEDIPLLMDHFLINISSKLKKSIKGIEKHAMEYLMDYPFPGNVRELKNIAERAVIMAQDGMIKEKHIAMENGFLSKSKTNSESEKLFPLQVIEKNIISQALKEANNNKSKTARLLGISRQALDRKITKLQIQDWAIAQNRAQQATN